MPSLGFMEVAIYSETVVRIKWALPRTNLILPRAAVTQHFNYSWEKATGEGQLTKRKFLLIIKMLPLNS